MTREVDVPASFHRAQLGQVVWCAPDGRPRAEVVVPLVLDGRPALALQHGRRELAVALADAGRGWLTVAAPGVARGADPIATEVTFTVSGDADGTRFVETGLLDQELACHPPSRRRLDNLVARRDHRWFVGRLLVTTEVHRQLALPGADTLIGVASDGAAPAVTSVALDLAGVGLGDALALPTAAPSGAPAVPLPDGPAVALQHGAEVPALEVRWHRRVAGHHTDGVLTVEAVDVVEPSHRRPTLRARLRHERQLRRACEAGLAAGARDPRGW